MRLCARRSGKPLTLVQQTQPYRPQAEQSLQRRPDRHRNTKAVEEMHTSRPCPTDTRKGLRGCLAASRLAPGLPFYAETAAHRLAAQTQSVAVVK